MLRQGKIQNPAKTNEYKYLNLHKGPFFFFFTFCTQSTFSCFCDYHVKGTVLNRKEFSIKSSLIFFKSINLESYRYECESHLPIITISYENKANYLTFLITSPKRVLPGLNKTPYSSLHSFIQNILCVRHCPKHLRYSSEQNKISVCIVSILVGVK